MTPGRPRRGPRRLDSRDGRPPTPPPQRTRSGWARQSLPSSPARNDADATQQSYAVATARPPGITPTTPTPRSTTPQLSPLIGMPSLRPRTTLRQDLDLANWTPLWNDDDAATVIRWGTIPPRPRWTTRPRRP